MDSVSERFPSLAILITWFGPWPPWFRYFLSSCEANPRIHWIFITDQMELANCPANVSLRKWTLESLTMHIEHRLELRVDIRHSYKLCDLKPAYGYLFEEEFAPFDFWGYGDLDLVYGRFENHFSKEDFKQYDLFSSHEEFVAGHLCLLRNSPDMIRLFMEGGHYRQAFAHPGYCGFDEQWLSRPMPLKYGRIKKAKNRIIRTHLFRHRLLKNPLVSLSGKMMRIKHLGAASSDYSTDFSGIVQASSDQGRIRVRYKTVLEDDLRMKKRRLSDWKVEWQNGSLKMKFPDQGKDLLYFHFMLSKSRKEFQCDEYLPGIPFNITPGGIKHQLT